MRSLENQVIVITGGASGIGLATAKAIAEAGGAVSIADADESQLTDTERWFQEACYPVLCIKVDVRNATEVDDWVAATIRKFGKITGALNAAGTGGKQYGSMFLKDMDIEEWNLVHDVNLTGMMYCLRAEIRGLTQGGSIVNISSSYGLSGAKGASAYTSSKHAVIGLTRSAAKECASSGVRVNVVCPGIIETPTVERTLATIGRENFTDTSIMGRFGQPQEVAAMIVWLLSSSSSFVTGATHVVDGGWNC